ncbi:LysR family transcriptional regulator [Mesorhizobium sp. IMUNJ 23033]|uniref:LysR family transcriptional regulator n=1 Tax=Mesorhizobium sp. IMUNJ 23033 TaxID=3378039 RepID=UPI0038508F49
MLKSNSFYSSHKSLLCVEVGSNDRRRPMSRNLDVALLRTFLTIAEEGQMTAAGRRLHLTQAAISQQVRRLEESLNCKLFFRGNRSLRLTPAGDRLLSGARAIVKLNDDVQAEMSEPPMLGEVRLGAPTDIVNSFLPTALRVFAREYPRVEVTLVCRTSPKLTEDWLSGEIDIAIVEEPVGAAKYSASKECLLVDRPVWIGARNGEAFKRSPLPVSLSNETNALRPAMVRALQEGKIIFRTVSEVGTMETVSATVRTDLAVTAVLRSTVPDDVDILGGRASLPELLHFEVNMLGSKEPSDPVAMALCNTIRDAFALQRRTLGID